MTQISDNAEREVRQTEHSCKRAELDMDEHGDKGTQPTPGDPLLRSAQPRNHACPAAWVAKVFLMVAGREAP